MAPCLLCALSYRAERNVARDISERRFRRSLGMERLLDQREPRPRAQAIEY